LSDVTRLVSGLLEVKHVIFVDPL